MGGGCPVCREPAAGGVVRVLHPCSLPPILGSWRLRPVQRFLRGRPAGAGGALCGGPGWPPKDVAPLAVQSAGPATCGRGDLQRTALPHERDIGHLPVSLWSRTGRAECDVCAGGRGHGGAGHCWALPHRPEAICPRAMYRGDVSSRLGPSGGPVSRRRGCVPSGQCQAGGSGRTRVDSPDGAVLRLLWSRPDGAVFRVRGLCPRDPGPGRDV